MVQFVSEVLCKLGPMYEWPWFIGTHHYQHLTDTILYFIGNICTETIESLVINNSDYF